MVGKQMINVQLLFLFFPLHIFQCTCLEVSIWKTMTMDNINLIKKILLNFILFSSLFLLMGIYRIRFTKICSFFVSVLFLYQQQQGKLNKEMHYRSTNDDNLSLDTNFLCRFTDRYYNHIIITRTCQLTVSRK